MPTLILTDLHGNLPALQAILQTPQARRCTQIISLGDQVNFGPRSRQVHDLLASLGAVMLLGNHEERLLHPDDAEFDGYNWRLMRWTARQMQGARLYLPTDLQRGRVLFTHGTPGDPYHLVQPPQVPQLLDSLPEGVQLLLSGHNHTAWDVTHAGKRSVNPGSAGMRELPPGAQEAGLPGRAPFLVLEDEELSHHEAAYDVALVQRDFVETGAWQAAPEMARAVVHVMQTAEPQGALKLIRHVSATAAAMGLTLGHEAAWKAADRTYPWPEPIDSEQYWKQMESAL